MREIAPQLWLGNARDVRDVRRLHEVGVRAVVDLALEEPLPELTREMWYCRFPLTDGDGNAPEPLSAAIETTASLIRKQVPTLIACSAGMSRSPSIAAAALAIVNGESPEETLQQILADNPHDVSPPLWTQVKVVYNDLGMR